MRRALATLVLLVAVPGAAVARPAGGEPRVFVTDEGRGRVVVLRLSSRFQVVRRIPVARGPHNIAATPDGRLVVATSPPAGRVTVIDGWSLDVRKVFGGFGYPHDVEFQAVRRPRYAYVTDEERGRLLVLDLRSLRVVDSVAVGPRPHDLAVAGRAIVVTHGPGQRILTLLSTGDPAHPRVRGQIGLGSAPHDIAFAAGGRRVWITFWNSGEVAEVGLASRRVVFQVRAGTLIHHVAVDPAGRRVWLTDHEGDRAVVLSSRTGRVMRRLAAPSAPHHVAFLQGSAVVVGEDGTVTAFGGRVITLRLGSRLHGVAAAVVP